MNTPAAKPGARRHGIGWLVLMLILFAVIATPFVITAIVMLGR